MTPALLARLQEAQAAKRPVALLTRLPDGEQRLWPEDEVPAPLSEAAVAALRDDEAGAVALDGEKWFVHPHNPPVRLIVVGAVHVAQALVPMAMAVGFAVTVVDPRRAFATPERFPGVSVRTDWPDEALDDLRPDSRTAVVTLTHDPKLDDPALDRALALRGRGPYVLQAAIASLHASSPVDWPQVAALYAELSRLTGSPVVELNRAVAVAEITHHSPSAPNRAPAHAASGMRSAVSPVDQSIGASVAPASYPRSRSGRSAALAAVASAPTRNGRYSSLSVGNRQPR